MVEYVATSVRSSPQTQSRLRCTLASFTRFGQTRETGQRNGQYNFFLFQICIVDCCVFTCTPWRDTSDGYDQRVRLMYCCRCSFFFLSRHMTGSSIGAIILAALHLHTIYFVGQRIATYVRHVDRCGLFPLPFCSAAAITCGHACLSQAFLFDLLKRSQTHVVIRQPTRCTHSIDVHSARPCGSHSYRRGN